MQMKFWRANCNTNCVSICIIYCVWLYRERATERENASERERDKVGEKERGNKSGRASWRTSCPVAMRTEMNYLSESQHQHTHPTHTHKRTHTCIHGSAFSAGTAAKIGSGDMGHGTLLCIAWEAFKELLPDESFSSCLWFQDNSWRGSRDRSRSSSSSRGRAAA